MNSDGSCVETQKLHKGSIELHLSLSFFWGVIKQWKCMADLYKGFHLVDAGSLGWCHHNDPTVAVVTTLKVSMWHKLSPTLPWKDQV